MASPVPLGNIPTPAVVATVSTADDLAQLRSPIGAQVADVIEFRLDSLTAHLDQCEAVASLQTLPLLFTARHPDEGGAQKDLSAEERSHLLQRFLPLASLIDVEIQSLDTMSNIVSEAKSAGVAVVASAHNFERSATPEEIDQAISAASEADIVKFAMWMDDHKVLSSLVARLQDSPQPRLSFMGMGPLGKLSRIVLGNFGSRLNYGYLFTPNAPGQWPSSELRSILNRLLNETA